MTRTFTTFALLCAMTSGAVLVGCDKTVAEDTKKTQHPDGTSTVDKTKTTQSPDGTKTQTTTEHKEDK